MQKRFKIIATIGVISLLVICWFSAAVRACCVGTPAPTPCHKCEQQPGSGRWVWVDQCVEGRCCDGECVQGDCCDDGDCPGECSVCNSSNNCEDDNDNCNSNDCLECDAGACVDICVDPETCLECNGSGECVSVCDPDLCLVCNAGSCVDICDDPDTCLECDGSGQCVSVCDPNLCQVCNAGTCVDICVDPDTCLECDGSGECVSACDPNLCQECDAGTCVDSCDDPNTCLECDGSGECVSVCDPNLCQECSAGTCVDRCVQYPCTVCDGSGDCVCCGVPSITGPDVICIGWYAWFTVTNVPCSCVNWSGGNPLSPDSGECFFITWWDTAGVETVTASINDCSEQKQVKVIEVASLLSDQGVEIDDGDGDPDTKSYMIGAQESGVAVIEATPNPNVSEGDLPGCWSLSPISGSAVIVDRLHAVVDLTTRGKSVIRCICGSSHKYTTIYVAEVEITNPQYLAENDPFDDSGRYCYNSEHPGVCTITAVGTTGVPELDAGLQWSIETIAGSTLTYDPDTTQGPSMTFRYTNLPPTIDDFGKKRITLTHPLLPGGYNSDTQDIEVYFDFAAKNWPGAEWDGGRKPLGFNPPVQIPYMFEKNNWYVYYSGTSAHVGCEHDYDESKCYWYDDPNYTPYVGGLSNPHQVLDHTHPCGSKPKNNYENLHGIDVFAWASRHEMKHHEDYSAWWENPLLPDDPRDQDVRSGGMPGQGDHIPDIIEGGFLCIQGGPYNPNIACTYYGYYDIGGYDDQAECMFTQATWTTTVEEVEGGPHDDMEYRIGGEYGKDWAYPGSRWYKP